MFAPLLNDTFLRACLRQPTTHTPVWLMRQAGRYLPEYLATRAKAGNSFMALATNVQYATEVTLQPLVRWPLDSYKDLCPRSDCYQPIWAQVRSARRFRRNVGGGCCGSKFS